MTPLDKSLLDDEQILFQTRKHFIIFLPSILLTFGCLIFLIYNDELIRIAAGIIGIAALISWGNDLLEYMTSHFAVTNIRVIMRENFFYKHTNEMRLSTIANAGVTQSLLGQYLQYGTVIIQPFGGPADPFTYIKSADEFQKVLQTQLSNIDKYKQILNESKK